MASKSKTRQITESQARARLAEAEVSLEIARMFDGSLNPAERKVASSNAVLAGIAASDAICGLLLGERAAGDDHRQAVDLLAQAIRPSSKAANSLRRLLTQKTPLQYGVEVVAPADSVAHLQWAEDVVAEARLRAR
jgi:hypothetical protein